MAGITFDELWEDLKNEDEESRKFFQTAEDIAKLINRLTEERSHQGLTQKQLAEKTGLKQSAIARLEKAETTPRLDTVVKVADALGLELKLEERQKIESITIIDTGNMFRSIIERAGTYCYSRYSEMPA